MAGYSHDTARRARGPASPLGGTGRVADDLYLIACHEVTGRPFLTPRALGTGLAGALLAELIDGPAPAVTLHRGQLVLVHSPDGVPVARYLRVDDPLHRQVLELLTGEPEARPARDWLLFLGRRAASEVAGRLEHAGYLARPARRIPGRPRWHAPVDRDWAHCALLRAQVAMNPARDPAADRARGRAAYRAREATRYAALLAGLTLASGLGFRLASLNSAAVRNAGEATRMLSPPLQELVTHVQATADSALLSQRK